MMSGQIQTQLTEWLQNGVDPEIRGLAMNLVSALGGASLAEDGPQYLPGDDALGVLRDLRRWFRQEQSADRLELARCLADLNFGHDIVGLIGYAKTTATSVVSILNSGKPMKKTASATYNNKLLLLAIDLLTAITWPIEIDETRIRKSHFAHIPVIRRAQGEYKRLILADGVASAVVMACGKTLQEREVNRHKLDFSILDDFSQNEGILRMGLYLIRNALTGSMGEESVEAETELRSAAVNAFSREGVFDLILALGSNIDRDFGSIDVVLMEILFYLLRGVDPALLFGASASSGSAGLKELLEREKEIKARENRTVRSRHSRFSGLIWVKDGDQMKTVSAIASNIAPDGGIHDLGDRLKKSRRKGGRKETEDETHGALEFLVPRRLTRDASAAIIPFLNDFLDSSFNPLFSRLRQALLSQADRVLEQTHGIMFFYLCAWFLDAQKHRRDRDIQQRAIIAATPRHMRKSHPLPEPSDDDGFSIVAAILSRPTFSFLHSQMQQSVDSRSYLALQAQMRCFTQLMTTVKDMSADSAHPENLEIAENMQSWMFYDETVHDRLLQILRLAEKRSLVFLDSVTDLVSVFSRMVESWGGAVVAKKVKKRASTKGKEVADVVDLAGAEESAEEDVETVTRERKFDAHRFAVRMNGAVTIRVFVAFLRHHAELSPVQLKRCHRFFYRVAFKLGLAVYLWQMPIIMLIHVVGRRGRASSSGSGSNSLAGILAEWNVLATHLFRMLMKQVTKRPETFIEMLFEKTPESWSVLEHGPDYEASSSKSGPSSSRRDAEPKLTGPFEFKPAVAADLDKNQRVGVAVMLLGKKADTLIPWLNSTLESARDGNKPAVMVADDDDHRAAVAWNGHFHLLLTELGFERPGAPVVSAGSGDGNAGGDVDADVDAGGNAAADVAAADSENADVGETSTGVPADGPTSENVAPPPITAWTLATGAAECLALLSQAVANPPYQTVAEARRYVRKVTNSAGSTRSGRKASREGDDSDDDSDDADDSEPEADLEMFPLGGPTPRRSDVARKKSKQKKKRLKRKRRNAGSDEDDDDGDDDGAKKRKSDAARREMEKRRRIKSTLFVHESDDEDDEDRDREFFAAEEQRRRRTAVESVTSRLSKTTVGAGGGATTTTLSDDDSDGIVDLAPPKRMRIVDQLRGDGSGEAGADAETDSDSDLEIVGGSGPSASASASAPMKGSRSRVRMVDLGSDGDSDDDDDDLLLGSATSIADRLRAAKLKERETMSDGVTAPATDADADADADEDDGTEVDVVVPSSRRRRVAGPFADSDDD